MQGGDEDLLVRKHSSSFILKLSTEKAVNIRIKSAFQIEANLSGEIGITHGFPLSDMRLLGNRLAVCGIQDLVECLCLGNLANSACYAAISDCRLLTYSSARTILKFVV